MEKIRIQIVNYKTKSYLIELLKTVSVDLMDFRDSYSIAIADNASGEDLSDIPSIFPDIKNIEIYQLEENVGFGAGHNFLAKKRSAKYLLLLNPDIKFIEPKTVERLIRTASNYNAQIVGPRLVTAENKAQLYDHSELKGLKAFIMLRKGGSYWKENKNTTIAAWVSGATFLVNSEWFKNMEGFDESFFLYKEEEDLCLRIRKKGGKIIYDPHISVFHKGSVVASKEKYIRESNDLFVEKHLKNKLSYRLFEFVDRIIK